MMGPGPRLQHLRTEPHDLDRRLRDPGLPLLDSDGDADPPRNCLGELVKGERGVEADHAPGHELGHRRERVVGIERSVRQLIEAAADLPHQALPLHARHGRGRGAIGDEFG